MRILHVIDSINVVQGGPSVSVPALAGAQAKLGHQVTIVCRDYGYLGSMVKPDGVEIRSVPSGRWTKGQGGWGCSFRGLVEEEAKKADVVHNHGVWLAANYYARRAANKAGKPLVISTRGMVEDWSLGRAVFRKFVAWQLFERKNLESAALFHATSESEAKSIEDAFQFKFKLKFKKPTVVVAPNGVDVPERIPGREILEARFPKLRGKEWVLFMSRIHPKKGLDLLLHAWKEQLNAWGQVEGGRWKEGQGLQATGYRNDPSSISQTPSATRTTVLVIAGADTQGYGKEVERMIREKGLGETVLMTGHVDGEVRGALLGNAKFFVLPSHSENFGLVVAESLAAGRPVLTTTGTPWGAARPPIRMRIRIKEDGPSVAPNLADSGGAMEGDGGAVGWDMNLERNGCGVICEVSGLKEALGRMLRFSDEELDEMGRKGRKMVTERFSWKAAAEKVVEAYEKIGVRR